jgi:hypothetical protein
MPAFLAIDDSLHVRDAVWIFEHPHCRLTTEFILRGPVTKTLSFGFVVDFSKKELELTGSGIAIQLLVPPLQLPCVDPSRDVLEFGGTQAIDCVLNLLNAAHV